MSRKSLVLIYPIFLFQLVTGWSSGLRDKYDGYGDVWMFMPNGSGYPQVAILKGEDPEPLDFLVQHIDYILFTRSNSKAGTSLKINDPEILRQSKFSASRKTKFITHGWKSSVFTSSILQMKDEYLINGDYNVILVNWEPLAASSFYLGPMRNTARVGRNAGEFITFLMKETGAKWTDMHFIGHSLGAHVAGNTGEALQGNLGRITGLDPALPGFHLLTSKGGRLDPSDAEVVDVIHSCGGVLGYLQPLGDVDFFPNAGSAMQPGCCCIQEITEACSHGRAYHYFIESINSETGFEAKKCDNWERFVSGACDSAESALMGEPVNDSARGSYYLRTGSRPPFAIDKSYNTNEIDAL